MPTAQTDTDRYYAVAVTLMRPTKLRWIHGLFGTWTPPERVYTRSYGMLRLGPSVNNYSAAFSSTAGQLDSALIAGPVTAHGPTTYLSYVTETDVAAVVNAEATYFRMMADLMRSAALTHYQTETTPGGARATSPFVDVPAAPYGSMVLDLFGQGYECDLTATVDGQLHFVGINSSKSAMTADGIENQWGYSWFGRKPLMQPIAATMDGKQFSWSIRGYSAWSNYQAFCSATVAALPANWDVDA